MLFVERHCPFSLAISSEAICMVLIASGKLWPWNQSIRAGRRCMGMTESVLLAGQKALSQNKVPRIDFVSLGDVRLFRRRKGQ